MKHNLIKTENYLLVVNDEVDIEENMFTLKNGEIRQVSYLGQDNGNAIIAHLPLNGAPYLDGVDVLPEIEDEVKKLAEKYEKEKYDGDLEHHPIAIYSDGYNKAKETYKYTEKQLDDAISWATINARKGDITVTDIDNFIQSLNQPKLPVAFISERITTPSQIFYANDVPYCSPKKNTTLRGTEWVGKYEF